MSAGNAVSFVVATPFGTDSVPASVIIDVVKNRRA